MTRYGLTSAALVLGALLSACAGHVPSVVARPAAPVVVAAAPVVEAPAPKPLPDPVAELIELSTTHFQAGQTELQLGHLESARTEFNSALEVLLVSPYGARSEPR